MLENNLELLVVEGKFTESELQAHWDKIYLQYCELSQAGTYNEILELSREIDNIRAKVTIVNNIISHLQLQFDQDLVTMLNSFALNCDLKEDDNEIVLVKKLNSVVARMKRWFTTLQNKEDALEKIRQENNDKDKIDNEYFDDWLDAMSKDCGYHISSEKIFVSRFCRTMVRMRRQSEKAEMQQMIK